MAARGLGSVRGMERAVEGKESNVTYFIALPTAVSALFNV